MSYTLTVYNTLTRKYESVAVDEAVYHTYKRSGWNIDDNDERFYAHEIQFSSLIGGEDDGYERFDEFVSNEQDPLVILLDKHSREDLAKALTDLTEAEQELLSALYFRDLTEREYAAESGIPQKTINDRKRRLLVRLKEILS